MIIENTQKVMRVLHADDEFFRKLGLNHGLKSMTAKQFIDIIDYLIHQVSGKNLINGRQGNCETEIINFMKSSLKYPGLINKYLFRTPNAPHAIHESIGLLAWLCDIIEYREVTIDYDIHTMEDSDFPSLGYTQQFSKEVQKGFCLWNKEEYQELSTMKSVLVNKLISERMNGRVETAEDLHNLTDKLVKKIEEAKKIGFVVKNEKKFVAVEQKYQDYELNAHVVNNACIVAADQLGAVEVTHDDLREKVEKKQKIIEVLRTTIKTQKRSADEMKQLLAKIDGYKDHKKTAIQELFRSKKELAENDEKYACLIQQKIEASHKLNKNVFETLKNLIKCQIPVSLDLEIYSSASLAEIEAFGHKTSKLMEMVHNIKQRDDEALYNIDIILRKLIVQEQQLIRRGERDLNELEKLKRVNHEFDTEIDKREKQTSDKLEQLNELVEEGVARKSKISREIDVKSALYSTLEKANEKILQEGNQKIQELLEKKNKTLSELENLITLIDDN